MSDRGSYTVLFLCTGNSARSILAEALLNALGKGRFKAVSAGSFPKGAVHPAVLDYLRSVDLPTDGLRSKAWDEFAGPDAPEIDFVITVCDNAANEVCPVWPGQPVTARWGLADPAAIDGAEFEVAAAFRDTARALRARIEPFVNLPDQSLGRLSAKAELERIHRAAEVSRNE